jgi:pimeloyl-ACP methyl ester carboxylesterase
LLIALPLGTRESLVAPAVRRLSQRYDVLTWEPRLVLTPEVELRSAEDLAVDRHVEDARAVLDHFSAQSAFLLGYCSGAMTALYVAAALGGRVKKLALVNGAYFLGGGVCERTQYEKEVQALMPMIAADFRQASFICTKFFQGCPPQGSTLEFGAELRLPYDNAESLYRFGIGLNHFMQCDPRKIARGITIPTLVATGQRDDQTHPATSGLIAAELPRGELFVDEGGDHYELCRARPALLQKIEEFFTGNEHENG